jgi:hypothetical protein
MLLGVAFTSTASHPDSGVETGDAVGSSMMTSQPQSKHEPDQPYRREYDPADSDPAGAERARRRDDVLWRVAQRRQHSKTTSRNTVRLPAGIAKGRRRKPRSAGRTS